MVISRSPSRPFCGDVSSGLPVFCSNILRFRSRFGGCLERGAHFHVPKEPPRGYLTVPFAAVLWGCLKRVCLLVVPTSFASGADLEDVSSEALIVTPLRGFKYSLRGAPHMRIYSHGPVRRENLGAKTFEYKRVSVVTVWS